MTESTQTTQARQTETRRPRGWFRSLARWWQRRMNKSTTGRIRRKDGKVMGMNMLILHTVGRRSEERRETPLSWFGDGDGSWLVVASGGGHRNPDWYLNLVEHPERASVEFHGREPFPVTPHRLDGPERQEAWEQITAAQPRYAKYQRKSDREYPVVRLTKG